MAAFTTVIIALAGGSPCAAQTLDTARFTASGIGVTLVLADTGARSLRTDAERVLRGGLEAFSAVFDGSPRDSRGRPARALTVQLSTGVANEGDSDPAIVIVVAGERPVFGFYSWRMVLLHELFHLWSAESFRYRDDREQWFNEGVAEYYTLRTATRLGLVPPEAAPAIVAAVAGFYSTAPGLGRISLREAGSTPDNKRANYVLVYHGGWIAGTLLDVDIRRRTRGGRSLDDLMRWLYANRDAARRRYGLEDLVEGLKATTGIGYGKFLSRYVDGTEALPFREYVNLGDAALTTYRRAALQDLAERGQAAPAQLPALEPAIAAALGLRR
jgi:predicted metalloprotease with PDZ domain